MRASASFTCLALQAVLAACDDVATVRGRIVALYGWPYTQDAMRNVSAASLRWATSLLPNGTWPDVNYNDADDPTLWATSSHMDRVVSMAAALSAPTSPTFNDDGLLASTRLALCAWYLHDWQAVNWWWDIIFVPQVHSLAFLMLDILPKDGSGTGGRPPFPSPYEASSALALSLRATWWNASLGYKVTGANLAWMVQAQLMRGVWPSSVNTSALTGGFARLWEEARVVDWDPSASDGSNQGVQVDGSYHMHGAQLQSASYGQAYTSDMLHFLAISAGTGYDVDPASLSVLCGWGTSLAWFTTGMGMDWAACGRQVSRSTWGSESAFSLNTTLLRALGGRCNASAASAIGAFADRADNLPGAPQLTGHRAFWTSDYAVARRQGWTAAWHGHSTRSFVNECGNGENLLGQYEAQGVLNVVSTTCSLGPNASTPGAPGPLGWGCGMEYATVFPLLDWSVLNGVTALLDLPVPTGCTSACCWTGELSASKALPFVGTATDGVYGVSAFDSSFLGLTVRKGYLFFDAAVVVLGANVSYTGGAGPSRVGTGMASRFLAPSSLGVTLGWANGTAPTTTDAVNTTLPPGQLAWAFADGVGWTAAWVAGTRAPAASVWAGTRSQPWSTIGPYPGVQTGRTLSLAILHGEAQGDGGDPLLGESFASLLVPDTTAGAMPGIVADALHSPVQLDSTAVVNTPALQAAVQVNATTLVILAIFWEAGSYSYAPTPDPTLPTWAVNLTLTQPCVVVYTEVKTSPSTSTVTLAVSNPDTPSMSVDLTVSPAGRVGCAPLPPFALNPVDAPNYLGASATQTCSMAWSTAPRPARSTPPLLLLPLGDSITKGCGTDATAPGWWAVCGDDSGGYRWPLYQAFAAGGVPVQFVGSQVSGPSGMPPLQQRHEGHPGWRVDQLLAINATWLAFSPDLILIHLGTNDIGQNRSTASIVSGMTELLSVIHARLPLSTLLVARIINMTNTAWPEWGRAVSALNTAMVGVVAHAAKAGQRVRLVDVNGMTGLCPAGGLSPNGTQVCCNGNSPSAPHDWVHPTAVGYDLMAAAWWSALSPTRAAAHDAE